MLAGGGVGVLKSLPVVEEQGVPKRLRVEKRSVVTARERKAVLFGGLDVQMTKKGKILVLSEVDGGCGR